MTAKEIFNRFLTQINLISGEYFLKEVMERGVEVQELANEGTIVIEELENLTNSWRDDTFLEAQKEAELLFTDEQMAALAAIRKRLKSREKRMADLEKRLLELDQSRQQLEKKLTSEDRANLGSRQLALISQEFWLQLALWRKRNLEERRQALVNLVEKLKTENQASLNQMTQKENIALAI